MASSRRKTGNLPARWCGFERVCTVYGGLPRRARNARAGTRVRASRDARPVSYTHLPQDQPKNEEKQDTAPTFFVRPVSGEVLRDYSGDELVYDRTMGDWRTHNGVDFLAADGALVCAVADGVIEDVYRDEYYGTCLLYTSRCV